MTWYLLKGVAFFLGVLSHCLRKFCYLYMDENKVVNVGAKVVRGFFGALNRLCVAKCGHALEVHIILKAFVGRVFVVVYYSWP